MNEIIKLRRLLHKIAELSGKEKNTSEFIIKQLELYNVDKIYKNIGGFGVIGIIEGIEEGFNIAIRSELDALPINENKVIEYSSLQNGVSHKCGHDGHMAILLGIAKYFSKTKPQKGKIILVFQPAEETGEGAARMLKDKIWDSINIDFMYGLHNLPGYSFSSIITKDGIFSSASSGVTIKLFGRNSHAAEPENGISPIDGIIKLSLFLNGGYKIIKYSDFVLSTIVNIVLGEKAFGTSPGYGEISATIRAHQKNDLLRLKEELGKLTQGISSLHSLKVEIEYNDEFDMLENNHEAYNHLKNAVILNNLTFIELTNPFRWSEDFGHFSERFKSCFFGLGAGEFHKSLHNPDYDFPDDLIEIGIKTYLMIFEQIQKSR